MSQKLLDWSAGTHWADHLSALRLFRYITVRSAGAAITALLLSWWLGPKIIHWLKQLKFGQDYADKAEEAGGLGARVLSKKGTPTMGGILIVAVLVFSTMLWAQWNAQVELTLLSVLVLAGLGFYDDYAKIIQQSGGGTPPRLKLWVQILLATFIGVYLWLTPSTGRLVTEITVPFYKYPVAVNAGWIGLLIVVLAIVGSSNAVNLTDGLDGLAIGCTLIVGFVFLFFTYLAGNVKAAGYLQIPYVNGAGELTVFCSALIGAGLGFLWFNCHPAQVFMGDTGSLPAGRRFRHHRRADSSAVCPGDCGRRVRDGSRIGHFADRLVSFHAETLWRRPENFFNGAIASSLREEGLVRIAGGDALLHFVRALRRRRAGHTETEMNGMINPSGKTIPVKVLCSLRGHPSVVKTIGVSGGAHAGPKGAFTRPTA